MNIPINPQDLLFALAPAAIAIITRPTWSPYLKFMAAVGVCVVASLLQIFLSGQFDPANIGLTLGKSFSLTMTAYAGIWKAFLPQALAFLENQVNPGPGGPPAPTKPIPAEFPGVDVGGPGAAGA